MELVITLLIAGVVLIFAEMVLPGMIAGIIGACCLVAGVVEVTCSSGRRRAV